VWDLVGVDRDLGPLVQDRADGDVVVAEQVPEPLPDSGPDWLVVFAWGSVPDWLACWLAGPLWGAVSSVGVAWSSWSSWVSGDRSGSRGWGSVVACRSSRARARAGLARMASALERRTSTVSWSPSTARICAIRSHIATK